MNVNKMINWVTPIRAYMESEELPEDEIEVKRIM